MSKDSNQSNLRGEKRICSVETRTRSTKDLMLRSFYILESFLMLSDSYYWGKCSPIVWIIPTAERFLVEACHLLYRALIALGKSHEDHDLKPCAKSKRSDCRFIGAWRAADALMALMRFLRMVFVSLSVIMLKWRGRTRRSDQLREDLAGKLSRRDGCIICSPDE